MEMYKKIITKLNSIGVLGTIKFIFTSKIFRFKDFRYQKMLSKKSNAERFSDIYDKNLWSSIESGSGEGSELVYTKGLRSWLIETLAQYKVQKLVDAACGDFNWMRFVLPDLELEYRGFDIVESVIRGNKTKYSNKDTHFAVADICNDRLPDCDILMVRDCLFHLSFEDINKFLENLNRVNYKILLTTSHRTKHAFSNKDISTGDFRCLDIVKSPLNFDPASVIERFQEPSHGGMARDMVMIKKENVPTSLKEQIV